MTQRETQRFVTAEMVQESVGKFGADLPWCKAVANRLNALLAAPAAAEEPRVNAQAQRKEIVGEFQQIFNGVRSKCLTWKDLETFLPMRVADWVIEFYAAGQAVAPPVPAERH